LAPPGSPVGNKKIDMKKIVESKFREIQKEATLCIRELLKNIPTIIENIITCKEKEN
jgi:hypothetical protein